MAEQGQVAAKRGGVGLAWQGAHSLWVSTTATVEQLLCCLWLLDHDFLYMQHHEGSFQVQHDCNLSTI